MQLPESLIDWLVGGGLAANLGGLYKAVQVTRAQIDAVATLQRAVAKLQADVARLEALHQDAAQLRAVIEGLKEATSALRADLTHRVDRVEAQAAEDSRFARLSAAIRGLKPEGEP